MSGIRINSRLHTAKVRLICFDVTCAVRRKRQALVDEVFMINEKYVLVEGIPSSICARCGEATFSKVTGEETSEAGVGPQNA